MRKLTADFILSPDGNLLRDHSLIISDNGTILDLLPDTTGESEYYEGILSPGFINTHCHLELSHFKNKILRGTGLAGFVEEFIRLRRLDHEASSVSMEEADHNMWSNGIQAVGDICNNESTFNLKNQSKIRYHSFVEIFNLSPVAAESVFLAGISLLEKAKTSHKYSSLSPHAPYSSSPELFGLIKKYHYTNPSQWCIHNQESCAENEMFMDGSGKLIEMFKSKEINMSWFIPKGQDSLKSMAAYFPEQSNILLVHNTFTDVNDIYFLNKINILKRCWFSLCVKANLYIENTLPDIKMLHNERCNITIGTDSLASNDSLSVLDELKVIHNNFPEISVAELLVFATRNGARFFGWDDLGAFRKNSNSGVIQITNADDLKLNLKSKVIRLI